MTTLAITPNWKNKTAKFKGTVAAGEHVSVTIQNDNGEGEKVIDDASTLRLRVVGMDGRTLAIFPEPVEEGETPEAWGEADLTPLTCTLNLNTVQMLKAVPPAANVPLLFVLDDYENKTLYFKEQFPVEHWPRKFGEEEPTPTNLDDYKDIIEDFNTRLTTAEQTVADAATDAQNAAASASAAAASAATAATAATDAQTGAIASKNAAQTAADNAAGAKTAAETAQGKAEEAQEAAETAQGKAEEAAEAAAESAAAFVVDDTLSVEGAAADAKAVGEANQDLITRIETVQDNLDNEVAAREELDGAVQADRQNLADEIARAQGAEQDLDNRKADKTAVAAISTDVAAAQAAIATKADKSDTYTKTEVDTKIAGVQTFQKYLVNELPDADEADMKGLYLVPTGETTEEGDLCEEWTVVEEDGEKRWEKIGGTTVDLDNYYTKSEVNGKLDEKQAKLYTQGQPGWTFSTESTGTEIEAFMANAANYSVTEEQSGSAWLYTLTGYDEENYYVTPVGRTAQSTSIPFYVFDVTQTSMYGSVLAEYSSTQSDVPAQVDTTPTANSGRLITSGAVHEATADAVKYVADKDGNKTAVTVGSRAEGDVGRMSLTVGVGNFARHRALATGDTNVVWDRCLGVGQRNTVGSVDDEKSFAAGQDNVVPTACSGAIGRDLQTSNNYEVTVGRGNVSRNGSGDAADTRFSIGIGGSGSSRRNAFEVMQSGTVYFLGVGGYEGTAEGAMGEDLATVISAILNGAVLNALGYEYSAWDMSAFPATFQSSQPQTYHNEVTDKYEWIILTGGVVVSDEKYDTEADALAALSITLRGPQLSDGAVATRTRTATSYRLGTAGGPNADKPLQSALSTQQLANIAAVSDALAFDATHSYAAGDPVVYDGTLYTFTSTHTGAWTGSDVSAVDIIARLAGKLDKSGGTMTGGLTFYDSRLILMPDPLVPSMTVMGAGIVFPTTSGTLALTAGTGHAGNLAALDASGNPTDAGWTAGDIARYALFTPTQQAGGPGISVTLADRSVNEVALSAAPPHLTLTFPAATSGKVRDFALRLVLPSSSTTTPELEFPQGVTLENADGEVPEIAVGGTTILYFTETAANTFLVKGETLTAITQA